MDRSTSLDTEPSANFTPAGSSKSTGDATVCFADKPTLCERARSADRDPDAMVVHTLAARRWAVE